MVELIYTLSQAGSENSELLLLDTSGSLGSIRENGMREDRGLRNTSDPGEIYLNGSLPPARF